MKRTSFSLVTALLLPMAAAQAPAPASLPVSGPAAIASSASSTAVAPLLSDLLRLAESAPSVRQAAAAQAQASAALAAARAAAGLSITAGADATVSAMGGTAAAGALPAQEAGVTTNAVLTLDGSLALLPWSPALESVRQAERAAGAAAAATGQARREAQLNTLRDYSAAVQAAESVTLSEEALAVSRSALASAEARARDGLLDPAGVLDAQAAVANAEADLSRARAGVGQAGRRLWSRLGQAAPRSEGLTGEAVWPTSLTASELTLPSLAERQTAALARRPEVLQARAALADAEARVRAAELDLRLPDASATLRVGQLGLQSSGLSASSTLNLRAGTLGAQVRVPVLEGDTNYRNGASLNVRASLPLVGGGRAAALAQAEAGLAQAREALTQAEAGVRLELDAAYGDLDYAMQSLAAAQLAQESARAALERTRARLEAGLDTPLSLRQAELQLARAAAAAAQAKRTAQVAWLDLWRLSGELETPLLLAGLGLPQPAASVSSGSSPASSPSSAPTPRGIFQ